MNEIGPLIEVSTHEVQTTDKNVWHTAEEREHKKEAHWYASEEDSKHQDEVLSRLIIRDVSYGDDGSSEGGLIKFTVHEKALYDKIFEYFDLRKNPSSFVSSLDKPIEFELYTTEYVTCWSSTEGTINCHHEWYGPRGWKDLTEDGKIYFRIDSLVLFEKFSSYAMKFKP